MILRRLHLAGIIGTASLLMPAAPVTATDDSADLSWLLGNWNVSYQDRALGRVTGRAAVTASTSTPGSITAEQLFISVVLEHPQTGQSYTLASTGVEARTASSPQGSVPSVRITLHGQSPWGQASATPGVGGAVVPHTRNRLTTGYTLRLPPGDSLTASLGSARDTIRGDLGQGDPEPSELIIDLAQWQPNQLSGSWFYPDPGDDGMRGRRAGHHNADRRGISGAETWERPFEPQIWTVAATDLDYRDITARPDLAQDRAALQQRFGENLGTVTWLEVRGQSLPTESDRIVEIQFNDQNVKWTGEREEVVRGATMRIRVALMRDVESGAKDFKINDTDGTWTFAFPDASPEAWCISKNQITQRLFAGDEFELELRFEERPFFASKRHVVMLTDRVEFEPVELIPKTDDPKVFRTPRTYVATERVEPPPAAAVITRRLADGTDAPGEPQADPIPETGPIPVALPFDTDVELWQVDAWSRASSGSFAVERLRNVTAPEILVYRPSQPGVPVDIVYRWDPIRVEVTVPRATYNRIGSDLEVEFKSTGTGASAELTLGARPPARGPVTYKTPTALSLAEGGEGGGEFTMFNWVTDAPDLYQVLGMEEPSVGDMSGLRTANNDEVTVSYGGAEAKFKVFDTYVQHHIENYRALFAANAHNYSEALVVPNQTPDERARAEQKLQLVANAFAILDHRPAQTERFTDLHRLEVAKAYERLLQLDPSTFGAGSVNERFGIRYVCSEEAQAVGDALGRAQQIYTERLMHTLGQSLIKSYQIFAAVTGAEAAVILIWEIDATGHKANKTQKYMAGLQLATQFLLMGSLGARGYSSARARMSDRHAQLGADLRAAGFNQARHNLFRRPMTGAQSAAAGSRGLRMRARTRGEGRAIRDSGEVYPSGHPRRIAAQRRIQAQQAVAAEQAAAALERLGLNSAAARMNADIWMNHGLTQNEIIAGASTIFPERISPAAAMRETGMSPRQMAAALDRFFETAQGVRDPVARAFGVHRALGPDTPSRYLNLTADAGTQAVPRPAPRPTAQPRPATPDAPAAASTPNPVTNASTGAQAARLLEELGVRAGVADVNAHIGAPHGLTPSQIAAGYAAHPGSRITASALMERTGMSAREVAMAIDQHYARVQRVNDPVTRARQVRRFLGDRTPDDFVQRANTPDPPPSRPPTPPPADGGSGGLPPGFREASASDPATTVIEPPPSAATSAPDGLGTTAIEAAPIRAQAARIGERLAEYGLNPTDQAMFARIALERGMTPDEIVAAQLLYNRDVTPAQLREASGLTAQQAAAGLDRYFQRMHSVDQPFDRARFIERLMGPETPDSYRNVRAGNTPENVERAMDHADALELDNGPSAWDMQRALDQGLGPDEAFAGWAMYNRDVSYSDLRFQTQLPEGEFAAALDQYLNRVMKEPNAQRRAQAIREFMGDDTPARFRRLAEEGPADATPDAARASALDDSGLAAALDEGANPRLLRQRAGLSPAEMAARLDRHLEAAGMTDARARAQQIVDQLGDEAPATFVERARGGPSRAMHCEEGAAQTDAPSPASRSSRPAMRPLDETIGLPQPRMAVRRYDGVPRHMENMDFVDPSGNVWKVGELIGEGNNFHVFKLRDSDRVIKFVHKGKRRIQPNEEGGVELGPDGDYVSVRQNAFVVEDAAAGARMARDAGVETPQVHAAVTEGSPFMVVDYLDPTVARPASEYINGEGLSPAQQRAVLRLFKKLGDRRIFWEDNHRNNVYLRQEGNEWVAGMYDTDRMITLDNPTTDFRAYEVYDVGGQLPGKFFNSLGGTRRPLPDNGGFWAERMLEYGHRWLRSRPGEIMDGALDLNIVTEPQFFPNLRQNIQNYHQGSSAIPLGDFELVPAILQPWLRAAA